MRKKKNGIVKNEEQDINSIVIRISRRGHSRIAKSGLL